MADDSPRSKRPSAQPYRGRKPAPSSSPWPGADSNAPQQEGAEPHKRRVNKEAGEQPPRRPARANGPEEPGSRADAPPRERKPWAEGERPAREQKPRAEGERPARERKPWADGERPPREQKPRPEGGRPPHERKPRAEGDRPFRARKPDGERPRRSGDRRPSAPEPATPPVPRNPRAIAAAAVHRVLAGESLTDALPELLKAAQPRDRGLVQEISYGVLRWGMRLQAVISRLLEHPLKAQHGDVEALLLVGLYQLIYLRTPPHAAVSETVQAARSHHKAWAAGLVNGILRRFQREGEELLAQLDQDPAVRHAHPQWLLERIRTTWPEQWEQILDAANQRPPMTLRVNLARIGRQAYAEQLTAAALPARPLRATPAALVLDRAVDTEQLPGFADGLVSVQDGGAQLAARLLDLQPGQRVLDACAAPGGKSGHILESAADLDLTALDQSDARLQRVRENLQRLGLQARVVVGDAGAPSGEWAAPGYQRILLDVPCSATGVIRRHPDIKWLRREEDIPALCGLQAGILDAVWPLLEPGGRLVYATCSLLPEENETQIAAFLARTPDARERPIDATWGHPRAHGRQTLPGEEQMDGFYYACIDKL